MRTVVEVFPVPYGMTPDEAIAEQTVFGRLPEYRWWNWRYRWPWRKWSYILYEEDDGQEDSGELC